MIISKLRALGGSVVVALPKHLLRSLNLVANDTVGVTLLDGRIIVEPQPQSRYRLADLVAQCDFEQPHSLEEVAWLEDRQQGLEIL